MFYRAHYRNDQDQLVMVADSEGDLAFVQDAAAAYASEHDVTVTLEQSADGLAWEFVE